MNRTFEMERDVYVITGVPPGSKKLIKKYGLLSAKQVAKTPEVLKKARSTKESQENFKKKVEEWTGTFREAAVSGPSVLFTKPDMRKITDKHFFKTWDSEIVRVNLSKLLEDYPNTRIAGAELLPILKEWMPLSDEDFEVAIQEYFNDPTLTYQDYLEARREDLTLDEVEKYTKMKPSEIWQFYDKRDSGVYYASNVPHAFIITPMGYIPFEYLEFEK